MQQKKRLYSDELKTEAVKMVNEQGLSQEETGRRLSIPSGTIANWVAASKSGSGRSRPGDPSVADLTASSDVARGAPRNTSPARLLESWPVHRCAVS